ncbi:MULTISPECIES: Hsp20 family protein [Euryhalocaulis]|uniref:Hsp20 family protein n=1 Tax=Euryhalocaulis TaxID=1712422 RepID=UPI0003B657FD|nr:MULTISPECIES: Hsp20 family protein [Euryhalocaulis]MBA4802002.1 Hsp20 family protein [Euryhalocaulis sp.]
MRTMDLNPLYRTIVGFDRLADLLDAAANVEAGQGYPPYNIEQINENTYRVELAVAGFGKDDLDLEVRENVLTVTGRKNQGEEDDGRNFVHRGIAERAFERRFHLADHVFVKDADLVDGLLVIQLQREIPEALKPRKIEIGSNGKSRKAIEGKSKAA